MQKVILLTLCFFLVVLATPHERVDRRLPINSFNLNGRSVRVVAEDEIEDNDTDTLLQENESEMDLQSESKGNSSTGSAQNPGQDDDEEEQRNTCEQNAVCFSNSDCDGGQCIGLGINRCACLSCVTGSICSEKHGCGGLKGACNLATSRCDCERAFKKHGFKSYGDALNDLCNVRYCVPNTDSCLGMPCNPGACFCNNVE